MRKLILACALLLGMCATAHAQGGIPYAVSPPAPGAKISVCVFPATGNPCTNPQAIFSDAALSVPISQPFTIGAGGNFLFYMAGGTYQIQITGRPDQIVSIGGAGLPTGCTSPGTGAITCTGTVLGTNLPSALPTTPNGVAFIDCSTPAGGIGVSPLWCWPGVPVNAQTGTTYPTFAATDRGSILTFSNVGATAVTPPALGSTNFANNFNFAAANINSGLVTFTPTTSTWNGNASGILPQNWWSFAYTNPLNNYRVGTFADIAAYPNCVDSAGNHLNFTAATGAFSCGTTSGGSGTVTTTGSPASSNCAYFSGATSIIGTANCTLDASGNFTIGGSTHTFPFAGVVLFDFTGAGGGTQFRSSVNNGTMRFVQNAGTAADFFAIKSNNVGGTTRQFALTDTNNTNLWSISAGKVDVYNQLQTAGLGVAPILAVIHSTGLTGAVSTATLCGSGATACGNAGQYHVHWNFIQTGTACTTNTTGGVTFLLTWTDTNATAHTAMQLSMDDSLSLVATTGTFHFNQTGNGLGTVYATGDTNISTNGAIIQYATGFSQCSVAGTATYQLDAAVTRLQ